MNTAHFKKVLDQITQHPETWNQITWHCGSAHCFAGWAQILSGKPANDATTRRDARSYLDLTSLEADWLFGAHRTIQDFMTFLRTPYNRAGYDEDGLDRNNQPPKEEHP